MHWVSRRYDHNERSQPSDFTHHPIQTKNKRGPLFYLELNFKIYNELRELKPDLIYSVDLDTLVCCSRYARKTKKQLLFDAHELFYGVPELESKRMKKWIWKRVAKSFIPKVDGAMTINGSLKDYYQNKYSTPFSIVRNVPLALNIETKSSVKNNKRIAYLGAVNKGRGVELMLYALTELKDYTFSIMGDGDCLQEMKDLAKELGVDDRTSFHGYTEPKDITSLLRECSLGINALVATSDNYRYSLANKFFDYMHYHLPSINMRFPEYESLVNEYNVGTLIDNYCVEDLVKAIRSYEDERKYLEHTTNCKTYKSQFTWEREKQVLLDLVAKTIS